MNFHSSLSRPVREESSAVFAVPAVKVAPPRRRRRRLFRHELRGLLRLAGPIVVSQLGQVGMNTADTVMVGPLGARALAAAGLGSALHIFAVIFCSGVLVGMTPVVSQAFGAGEHERCRRTLVQGVWLALALSVPVALFSALGGPLAELLGQQPAVASLAGAYMRALAWGVPPAFVFVAGRQYLEGMGVVKPTMVITFLGVGLNILANWLLIYGVPGWIPAMGVVGSGWATTIVRWAMLAGLALLLVRHRRYLDWRALHWRVERALLARVARIGAPIGGQLAFEVGLFSFAAVMMGWLGPVELAAHQVTINLASITFMVALGVSLAGSVRVGHHIGAGRARAARRAALGTYLLAVGFMALCALWFLWVPRTLIGLYTPDPAIIELGARLLFIAALFQVFDGAQVAGISVLRGSADTRTPMLAAAVGYWLVGLPVGYLLAFRTPLRPLGIWAGFTAGLAAVAILLALRVRHRFWQTPLEALRA